MKLVFGVAAGTAAMIAAAQASAATESPTLPSWLAGAWIAEQLDGSWSEEWWTTPRGGIMLGAARSGKGDKAEWWEQTRIEQTGEKVSFCALPKGQMGACFVATDVSANAIVFENPSHDFPTRIVYRRDGNGLVAEISGPDGANAQRWQFRRAN